ncbi:DUF2971 domain-containing protein [Microbulbifer sp. SSSA008]|uniref:DUF2971 domain-containing protein n=1 Tax=Microbulbifer sp. SSSA008 TaxID=3243380 RepID=UPI00403A1683
MILYQYRGVIAEERKFQFFIDLIKDGSMMFSKPSDFNDPFDCCPTQFSEFPENELPHAVTDAMNHHIQQATSHIVGVSCLTPHPDRMLMWSHYGDQHRSVCVGFDTEVLMKDCPKNSEGNPLYSEIRKVDYTNTRPDENDQNAIFKKSKEWCYENEYRIVSSAKKGHPQWGPGVWKIPKTAIKEVVIGARVPHDLQEKIVNELKFHRPDILRKKAVLHAHTYELKIENLDTQPKVAPMSGYVRGPNGDWINT